MEYWKNGIRLEAPDLTEEEKERIAQQKEQEEASYWRNIPYGIAVDKEVRKKYAQHQVEAILNNYLAEPDNEEYAKEFHDLQEYRTACKAFVKEKKLKYESEL